MPKTRGLFRKYVTLIVGLVGAALLASGAIGIYFAYSETRAGLLALESEKARAAAARIEQFVRDIERQLVWTTFPVQDEGPAGVELRRLELLKLLRQVPAATEASYIDGDGREQVRVSRIARDAIGSGIDLSHDPRFVRSRAAGAYFGPVYFVGESEPYMPIAVRAERGGGVATTAVNLKFIWNVITQVRFGATGLAYLVDADGSLISHPDISLVLKRADLSELPQVSAALAAGSANAFGGIRGSAVDLDGRSVLTAYARVEPPGWTLFVEQAQEEALQPLRSLMLRNAILLVVGLALAVAASVLLARHMTRPIEALSQGAAAIGTGDLEHRIEVVTGDELEDLGERFNQMARDLRALEHMRRLKRFLAPQVAELIAEGAASLQSHRREVVVVFLDLRGFTSFTESFAPEEVMGVLGEFHEAMGRLIVRYEGTLERFLGDGIMILFNDPIPVPDASARAARMTMEMRTEFARLADAWKRRGIALDMGIGIARGEATLGTIGFEGRQDYSAIGPVCNLAARLCAEAKGGQILVPESVRSSVETVAEVELVGELTLKGIARPVAAWNLVRNRE